MTQRSRPPRVRSRVYLCALTLLLGGISPAWAQREANPTGPPPPTQTQTSAAGTVAPRAASASDERNRAELLESYQYLREQLRAAQLAIASNRVDAEETVRLQTATLTAKVESMKIAVAAINKRQQEDAFRSEYDRIHQQEQSLRSNRSFLWIAGIAGASVLLTLLIMARLQWHAMNRIAEAVTSHPQLLAQNNAGWLPPGINPALSEKAVSDSNQRLASAVERIERRIGQLEHTAKTPSQTTPPSRERRVYPADT